MVSRLRHIILVAVCFLVTFSSKARAQSCVETRDRCVDQPVQPGLTCDLCLSTCSSDSTEYAQCEEYMREQMDGVSQLTGGFAELRAMEIVSALDRFRWTEIRVVETATVPGSAIRQLAVTVHSAAEVDPLLPARVWGVLEAYRSNPRGLENRLFAIIDSSENFETFGACSSAADEVGLASEGSCEDVESLRSCYSACSETSLLSSGLEVELALAYCGSQGATFPDKCFPDCSAAKQRCVDQVVPVPPGQPLPCDLCIKLCQDANAPEDVNACVDSMTEQLDALQGFDDEEAQFRAMSIIASMDPIEWPQIHRVFPTTPAGNSLVSLATAASISDRTLAGSRLGKNIRQVIINALPEPATLLSDALEQADSFPEGCRAAVDRVADTFDGGCEELSAFFSCTAKCNNGTAPNAPSPFALAFCGVRGATYQDRCIVGG